MSELTSNIEVAHKLHEHGLHHVQPTSRRDRWVEILEAVVLATVAVLTAWGGYQAFRWEALSAKEDALATRNFGRAAEGLAVAGEGSPLDLRSANRCGGYCVRLVSHQPLLGFDFSASLGIRTGDR